MIAVINILFPVISIILLGVIIGKIETLDSNFFSGVNRLVYKYGLAPLLFVKTAGMSVPVNQAAGSITVMILLILFLTATAWIAAQALSLSDKSKGAFIHGAMRGNYAYIGLPVIFYAFSGTAMADKSTEMAIIIFTPAIIFHNGLAIFLRPSSRFKMAELLTKMFTEEVSTRSMPWWWYDEGGEVNCQGSSHHRMYARAAHSLSSAKSASGAIENLRVPGTDGNASRSYWNRRYNGY